MDLEEVITTLEIRQWEALRSPRDAEAYYSEFFADDGLMATPTGVYGRSALVAGMDDSPVIVDYEIRDKCVIPLGENAGIIAYTMTQTRAGMKSFDAAICSVFECADGRWRMVYHQQTPLRESLPWEASWRETVQRKARSRVTVVAVRPMLGIPTIAG
jgi:hypothetical protein